MATLRFFPTQAATALAKQGGFVSELLPDFLRPSNVNHPFATALQDVAEQQIRADAARDVKHMAVAGLGLGAGAAGLAGLARVVKRSLKKRPAPDSGVLPLPVPATPADEEEDPQRKAALDRDLLTAGALGLAGGGLGAGLGAALAPQGHRREGSLRGLAMGAPAGLGAYAYGKGLKDFIADRGVPKASTIGLLAAGSASGLPAALLGRPSWDHPHKEERSEHDTHDASATPQHTGSRHQGEGVKTANLTMKAGVPWYGPSMLFSGLGGAMLGWKGVDSVLKSRARKQRQDELDSARQEFQDALLSQYDQPADRPSKPASDGESCPHCAAMLERSEDGVCNRCGKSWPEKTAGDGELGRALDELAAGMEKLAATWGDVGGMAAGGYGMYAGLTGLLTGALVYDKMKKRSRRAILEKALQRRERRKFNLAPTEMYAQTQPAAPAAPMAPAEEPGEEKLGFFVTAR